MGSRRMRRRGALVLEQGRRRLFLGSDRRAQGIEDREQDIFVRRVCTSIRPRE
jgi:hypothetical protein